MAKPTTVRIPDDLLDEIERFIEEQKLDRSTYLREVLRKGFLLDREDRILKKYASGELSLMQTCRQLGCDAWEILPLLHSKNLHLNVQLEDWLDATNLE